MKVKRILSLALTFAIVCAMLVIQTVPVSAITTTAYNEGFNDAILPTANWTYITTYTTTTIGTITSSDIPSVADKSMVLKRTATGTSSNYVCQAKYTGFNATPATGEVVVLDVKTKFTVAAAKAAGSMLFLDENNKVMFNIYFTNKTDIATYPQGISVKDSTNTFISAIPGTIDNNKFYNIRAVMNFATSTFDVYIDGVKYMSNKTFQSTTLARTKFNQIRFDQDYYAASSFYYVNDLKVSVTGDSLVPSATNLSITGDVKTGKVVTASYDFTASGTGEIEGASTYQWMVCDTIDGTYTNLSGKTAKTMTITSDLLDKYLKVNITPKDIVGYTGTTLTSEAVGPVVLNTDNPTATAVSYTNNNGVLTGQYTYGSPVSTLEGTSTYRWLSSDTEGGSYSAISGANAITYTPDYTNAKKYIKFEVTPIDDTALAGNSVLSDAQKENCITQSAFDNNFNNLPTGSLPEGWVASTTTNAAVEVVDFPSTTDKSIRLFNSVVGTGVTLTKTLGNGVSGTNVTCETSVFLTDATNTNAIYLYDASNNNISTLGFYNNQIQHRIGATFTPIQAFTTNTWYNFKYVINFTTKTYDLYINNNDTPTATGLGFRSTAATNLAKVQFQKPGNAVGNFLISNASITSQIEKFAPSAVELFGQSTLNSKASIGCIASYSALLKDRFGNEMNDNSVSYSINGSPSGITVNDGIVSVTDSSLTSFTIKASSSNNNTIYSEKTVTLSPVSMYTPNTNVTDSNGLNVSALIANGKIKATIEVTKDVDNQNMVVIVAYYSASGTTLQTITCNKMDTQGEIGTKQTINGELNIPSTVNVGDKARIFILNGTDNLLPLATTLPIQ